MNANQIREKRMQLNLTQTELAEKFGVTTTTIARWERGERKPDAQGMITMAFKYLEIEALLNNEKLQNLKSKVRADVGENLERLRIRHSKTTI